MNHKFNEYSCDLLSFYKYKHFKCFTDIILWFTPYNYPVSVTISIYYKESKTHVNSLSRVTQLARDGHGTKS